MSLCCFHLCPSVASTFLDASRWIYRKILTGILFVLKTGIAWADLPAELGCGCGKTCREYLKRFGTKPASGPNCTRCCSPNSTRLTRIDWRRALIDASFAKAPSREARIPARTPRIAVNPGARHHVLTDAPRHSAGGDGNGGQRHRGDGQVRRPDQHAAGRWQARASAGETERLQGDTGYDSEPVRQLLRWLGITPIMGERRQERMAVAWGYTAGSWNGRSPGCIVSVGYAAGWTAGRNSKTPFLQLACGLICLRFVVDT